ncbi:MAG: flavodoxin family protein [Desulfobacter sp.]|nr:MAG: flavodoxin family protein [Desulfobacter sp.]
MKITCLKGSPRKNGNSSTLADHLLQKLATPENSIATYYLNTLNYRGCQGCRKCLTLSDKCILKDDMATVLETVRQTDVLVISSPVYYGDVTSQAKAFIDRTYSYYRPDFITNPLITRLTPGKKLIMVLTQAHPDEALFSDIFPKYDAFFRRHNFTDNHLVRACGVMDEGDIKNETRAFEKAARTAELILSH